LQQGDDGRQVGPYHPSVSNDRAQTVPSLFDAVRALARGDDLETTLASLCAQACTASGAPAGGILLYDAGTVQLSDAAGEPVDVAAGDDPVAGVLRERAADWDATLPPGLGAIAGGAVRGAIIPLVREDQAGATVEGLLVLAAASAAPLSADAPNVDTLLAIGDLAAVAIRQERLRSTSAEGVAYQERLARTDPLTGLADRHTFGQMLELELARATRLGTSLAVAIFDVDDLATINEQHGQGVGDDVLRSVAATLAVGLGSGPPSTTGAAHR
jgi:GAF domain-containing protein